MEFFLKFRRVPQRTLGQSDNLPSVTPLALGKDIYSPSASKDTRQNQTERPAGSCYGFFAECHILDTRHTLDLPSVYITALGKSRVCRVSLFCRVFNCLHSVKGSFAECSNFGTRQSRRHSANIGFPVVNEPSWAELSRASSLTSRAVTSRAGSISSPSTVCTEQVKWKPQPFARVILMYLNAGGY